MSEITESERLRLEVYAYELAALGTTVISGIIASRLFNKNKLAAAGVLAAGAGLAAYTIYSSQETLILDELGQASQPAE